MKFICYSDWDQLPDSANALFEQAAKDSVYFSQPWLVTSATETANDNQTLLLACVVADNQEQQGSGLTFYMLNSGWLSLSNVMRHLK